MQIPQIFTSGKDAENWKFRRSEIMKLFEENVYGKTPKTELDEVNSSLIQHLETTGGICKNTYMLRFRKDKTYCGMRFEVYYPLKTDRLLPSIVLINPFSRNPYVLASEERAHEYFPYDIIVAHGYAAVQVSVDDICMDDPQQFQFGLMQLIPRNSDTGWGALGVWAWAASRVVDFLCETAQFDAKRIAVAGCSRAGKAALWCGAQDERIAAVISIVSGCTGAAMARGKQGERIQEITSAFPYWTCERYASFAGREDDLPVDQHMLLALCAPRPLYVSSASEDAWAHPEKEFESCVRAGEAYRALGTQGLASEAFPKPNTPIFGGNIAYHVRKGEHGCCVYDWEQYIRFLDRYFHEHASCGEATT